MCGVDNYEALTFQTEHPRDGPHGRKTSSLREDQLYPWQQQLSKPKTHQKALLV